MQPLNQKSLHYTADYHEMMNFKETATVLKIKKQSLKNMQMTMALETLNSLLMMVSVEQLLIDRISNV